MKIRQILKNSSYNLDFFQAHSLQSLESRIIDKTNGGGANNALNADNAPNSDTFKVDTESSADSTTLESTSTKSYKSPYYATCLIRDKEIKLTPEEVIRQLYLDKLINEYGYKKENIKVEYPVHFGREIKKADIVILDELDKTTPYIVIELKKPLLKDGKEQLKSYCNATGAIMAVWCNGIEQAFFHRKNPNYFEPIKDIPKADKELKDILNEPFSFRDLMEQDILIHRKTSLKKIVEDMEDEVLANAGVDVFEEVFKLIFIKLYDELEGARNEKRDLEFKNAGEQDSKLKIKIENLFDKAKSKWEGVFNKDDKIKLTPSHLSVCISSLERVKLFNSNLEIIDEAFEYLVNKSAKSEKGQYFTPRYVIDMCVRMLNPKADESMIDTASGSCGFPIHTCFYVWNNIYKSKGIKASHLFTAEKKLPECEDYVREKVFGIDFDEKSVRVSKMLNLIAGDGHTNVLYLNSLDFGRWNNLAKEDETWSDIYYEGWKRLKKLRADKDENRDFNFDILMANPPFAGDIKESRILARFELSKKANGKMQNKIGRDILFIERNLNMLRPGGRMAIVLPQGRFNNSSDKHIREFIANKARILAVVGLHGNVFKPHTGTKTSVLFLQKWGGIDENGKELCPKCDDYNIFFATMSEPSKDNSGEKIYERDESGEFLLDSHGHKIVKHDLFNHDNLTQDGIAEAFIDFAKMENLSFWRGESLTGGGINDAQNISIRTLKDSFLRNGRIDSEYYHKKYDVMESQIKSYKNSYFTLKSSEIKDENFIPKYDKIYRYIELADIESNGSIRKPKSYFGIALPSRARRIVKEGDVIISSIEGSLESCALITKEFDGSLVSTGFYVIRSERLNSESLFTIFTSTFFQNYLRKFPSGTILTAISKGELQKILIPLLDAKTQERIAQKVKSNMSLIQKIKEDFAKMQENLISDMFKK